VWHELKRIKMMKKIAGFTLIELLVVVTIVAILAALAYPSYIQSIIKGNRSAVQGDLQAAAAAMAAYRTQNFSYNGAALGTDGVFRNYSPENGKQAYNLAFLPGGSTNTDTSTFHIVATPVTGTSQAGTGALAIDQTGGVCWNPASDSDCTPGDPTQKW
jgi:type IV pilus assembly protein PilE